MILSTLKLLQPVLLSCAENKWHCVEKRRINNRCIVSSRVIDLVFVMGGLTLETYTKAKINTECQEWSDRFARSVAPPHLDRLRPQGQRRQ